jgi:hypothetical protein
MKWDRRALKPPVAGGATRAGFAQHEHRGVAARGVRDQLVFVRLRRFAVKHVQRDRTRPGLRNAFDHARHHAARPGHAPETREAGFVNGDQRDFIRGVKVTRHCVNQSRP